MAAYYNENDQFSAEWLRQLIKAGHIADGIVDERSIVDVQPEDVKEFTQCHWFAGIGTWSYALRAAMWPDDRHVWTGSPPCQPFSAAGKQKGKDDDRHLAPHWLELVTECGPAVVFGEQVAAAIRHGWFDDLQTHLEAENYAVGMVVLPACGIGAPHIRQRQWIVAERLGDTDSIGQPTPRVNDSPGETVFASKGQAPGTTGLLLSDGLAHTNSAAGQQIPRGASGNETANGRTGRHEQQQDSNHRYSGDGENSWLANTERDDGRPNKSERQPEERASGQRNSEIDAGSTGPTNGFWRDPDWLFCRDGKWRPVESGTFPLVNGTPARVGRLRGYGNGIVAPLAQAFIEAYRRTLMTSIFMDRDS